MTKMIELINAETAVRFSVNTAYIITVKPVKPYYTDNGTVNAHITVNEVTEAVAYKVVETHDEVTRLCYIADKG